MRYTALSFASKTVYSKHISYTKSGTPIYYSSDAISHLKENGFRVFKEKDGIILMRGSSSNTPLPVAVIPETHPAFNGSLIVSLIERSKIPYNIYKVDVRRILIKIISDIFKEVD